MAKAREDGGSRDIKVDWGRAQEEPVQAVNVFAAQANPHFHLLNLGFIAPPVAVDQEDARRINRLKSIQPHVVARIFLTPDDMQKLVQILSDNIESRQRLFEGLKQEE